MKRLKIYILILSSIYLNILNAQIEDRNLYFGQKPPGETPKIFSKGFISLEHRYEGGSTYSPDMKEFYFSITNKNWNFFSILFTKYENGHWTTPDTVQFLKSLNNDGAGLCFSSDGKKIFFNSAYPKWPPVNIWMCERINNKWQRPVKLESPINSDADEWSPCVSQMGTLYFCSRRKEGIGGYDIYKSKLDSCVYTKIENLGEPINTKYADVDPYIAPDESFIVFGSNRPGGYGDSDLYISFQNSKGGWTDPKNLGPSINSKGHDGGANLSPDGKYFFFSQRDAWNTEKTTDIYWVDSKVIFNKKEK